MDSLHSNADEQLTYCDLKKIMLVFQNIHVRPIARRGSMTCIHHVIEFPLVQRPESEVTNQKVLIAIRAWTATVIWTVSYCIHHFPRIYTSVNLVNFACRFFRAKPLPELMMAYCQLDSSKRIRIIFIKKAFEIVVNQMAAILSWGGVKRGSVYGTWRSFWTGAIPIR